MLFFGALVVIALLTAKTWTQALGQVASGVVLFILGLFAFALLAGILTGMGILHN